MCDVMLRAYLRSPFVCWKKTGTCGVMHRCSVEEVAILSSELALTLDISCAGFASSNTAHCYDLNDTNIRKRDVTVSAAVLGTCWSGVGSGQLQTELSRDRFALMHGKFRLLLAHHVPDKPAGQVLPDRWL
jgi:hypothetical protein